MSEEKKAVKIEEDKKELSLEDKKKKNRKIILILVIVVVSLCGLCGIFTFKNFSVEEEPKPEIQPYPETEEERLKREEWEILKRWQSLPE